VDNSAAARRLTLAFDMYELGEQMQRARLRRLNPAASEADIAASVKSWLLTRPGADLGDAEGRPSSRFA
jgi:Rv0078B-related antitoxin